MRYNLLPNTTFNLPEITLGTMTFGGQTNLADSLSLMDYAYEQGMTLFDTANIYNVGESEKVVGKWLQGRRDQVILASKVGYPMGGQLGGVRLDKAYILQEFNASLERLQTDYIDLYYMHAPDNTTSIEKSLETMTGLIESGKVKYFGVSNFAAWQIADLLAACDKHGFFKPVITQNVYNAITRTIEPELLPFLKAHDIGLTVYNPIAAGLLTDKHRSGIPAEGSRLKDNATYNSRYWSEANLASARKLASIADDAGLPFLELVMKFCASNPQVNSVITGVSRLSQLEENLKVMEGEPLSPELLALCDNVWQTHTGNPFGYSR